MNNKTPYEVIEEFNKQPSSYKEYLLSLVPSVRKQRLENIQLELKKEQEKLLLFSTKN